MNECCELASCPMIKFLSDALLVALGAYFVYVFGLMAGKQLLRKKSLHDVADVFAEEAKAWAHHTFEASATALDWHKRSVYHLSAHADYVEARYPETWKKMKPYWDLYRCNPLGITESAYIQTGRKEFVRALYLIADILREA
jgi:hypothetical protein